MPSASSSTSSSTSSSGDFFPPLPYYNGLSGIPELCLYSGAKFKGEKRWRKGKQAFEVEFQYVDRDNEFVYGTFTVKGAGDVPLKITYFDGEIVGSKHSFLTRKWNANSETDVKHWWKFDCFCKYAKIFTTDDFDYDVLKSKDQLYMRWKERSCKDKVGFVAPGFYYVCLTKSVGVIDGIYYERFSEDWNEDTFKLSHVQERSLPVFQFR